ncbi:MAG TPA: DNA polymerase III subunit beta [Cyanobacteria bacterium UBA11049]|nr:DNA polymerase III subunit beta [Cyanobacteria bacterium UBA11049]
MKLVCNQSDLSTNMTLVSRAVPSRPTHPVLANVLLQADAQKSQVSLTAFDLSLGIRTSFPAEVETSGAITLPAKLLNDIVARMPQGEITLEDEAAEVPFCATIVSTSGRYQVHGMGVDDFPELPILEKGEAIELPAEALLEGIKGSLLAASTEEAKQILSGVHLSVSQDTLEFAATDGHRLAVVKRAFETETEDLPDLEVTIPAKALRELERMLGTRQSSEALSLNCDRGQIVFEWADQCLTSRTLEGQYPAYRQLIPHQFERQITMDRRQLLSALERIAVLADQKNNIVKFNIDSNNQEIALSVNAQDVGSGRELLQAQISGESLDIAFNIKYLMDGIKAIGTPEIQMQLNAALTPVILTPLGGLKMTYLIMPVQIRN